MFSHTDHGLSSAKLQQAAERIQDALPFRWCFVVVKDGVLVHESYFHNNSETLYRTQVGEYGGAMHGGPVVCAQ